MQYLFFCSKKSLAIYTARDVIIRGSTLIASFYIVLLTTSFTDNGCYRAGLRPLRDGLRQIPAKPLAAPVGVTNLAVLSVAFLILLFPSTLLQLLRLLSVSLTDNCCVFILFPFSLNVKKFLKNFTFLSRFQKTLVLQRV